MAKTATDLKRRLALITDLGKRTEYERDYTAILYSHAFRRLRHKTQVFYFPVNDHICTRLDHSLYVASTAAIICRNLCEKGILADPMLAQAIGLGHDLGHAPFGHAGQNVIDEIAKSIGGFKHEKHGLRIVDKIEKPDSRKPVIGLNLTLAVRDGIANHNGESKSTTLEPEPVPEFDEVGKSDSLPCTIEGCIVRLVDKVAYMGRDIEDAIVIECIKEDDLPARIRAQIGAKNGEIVDYFVKDIIKSSSDKIIRLSDDAAEAMAEMMEFNYKMIYEEESVKEYLARISEMLKILYEKLKKYSLEYKDNISKYNENPVLHQLGEYINRRKFLYFSEEKYGADEDLYTRIIVDFISTLTDRFVFDMFSALYLPRPY